MCGCVWYTQLSSLAVENVHSAVAPLSVSLLHLVSGMDGELCAFSTDASCNEQSMLIISLVCFVGSLV